MEKSDKNIQITTEMVERVAGLARLELTGKDLGMAEEYLGQVIDHFNQLSAIDTSEVEPACHPHDLENQLRDDVFSTCLSQEEITKLTAVSKDGCLMVPRTVD